MYILAIKAVANITISEWLIYVTRCSDCRKNTAVFSWNKSKTYIPIGYLSLIRSYNSLTRQIKEKSCFSCPHLEIQTITNNNIIIVIKMAVCYLNLYTNIRNILPHFIILIKTWKNML